MVVQLNGQVSFYPKSIRIRIRVGNEFLDIESGLLKFTLCRLHIPRDHRIDRISKWAAP